MPRSRVVNICVARTPASVPGCGAGALARLPPMPRKRHDRRSAPVGIARRRQAAADDPTGGYVARKQALLSAAASVFRDKGFQAVRMDDVAEELGVDRATLYYYFGNKQQLFREVIHEALEANLATAQRIAASDQPPADKLRELLVELIGSYERHYPLLFVYVQEDMRKIPVDDSPQSQRLLELGTEYDEAVKQIIQEGIDAGEFAPQNPTLTAYFILGAANWTHRWFDPSGGLSGEEVGALLADHFLDGILIGAARRRRRRPVGQNDGAASVRRR
jgi:TetR/AcrR family transcriptional regulator, cholesterol catabolism regulator